MLQKSVQANRKILATPTIHCTHLKRWLCTPFFFTEEYILLTKTTAVQNEDALTYLRMRGLYYLAVVFVTTIVLIRSNLEIWKIILVLLLSLCDGGNDMNITIQSAELIIISSGRPLFIVYSTPFQLSYGSISLP